jgi:hypothetical protein
MSGDNGFREHAEINAETRRVLETAQDRFREFGDPRADMIWLGEKSVGYTPEFRDAYLGTGGIHGAAFLYKLHSEHVDDVRTF